MWSSWEDVVKSARAWYLRRLENYRAWTTWDDWVLATYRDRIDFQSFCKNKYHFVSPAQKDYILRYDPLDPDNPCSPRNAILEAIKRNDKGEHYNRQTSLYIFAKFSVMLIAASSGFVISNILGAHFGLAGASRFALAVLAFSACFISNFISFRVSVPGIIRRMFEWDKFGSHFFAKQELTVYRNSKDGMVRSGYFNESFASTNPGTENKPEKYLPEPGDDSTFNYKQMAFLGIQFVLVTVVGLVILAQTVEKAGHGVKGVLPFLIGAGVANPLAWVMGVGAFVCMLGQYMYSMVRMLRQKDKLKEFRAVFNYTEDKKFDWRDPYNWGMGLVALGLSFFVGLGMYGTSNVQATSFMNLIHASKATIGQIIICASAMGGKLLFTMRAMVNFLGIFRASTGALGHWMQGGKYESPFDKRRAEDELSGLGAVSISLYALAKSSTAVQPPEPGASSELFPDCSDMSRLDCVETQFWAWSAVVGALIRTAQEPLDKFKPKSVQAQKQSLKTSLK